MYQKLCGAKSSRRPRHTRGCSAKEEEEEEEVKPPGCEADDSYPSSEEVNNSGVTPPFPNASSWRGAWLNNEYSFVAWYLVKHRDKVTLTLVTAPKTTRCRSWGTQEHTKVYPKVSGLSRNEIYAYNNKHSLRSNTKDYCGKVH
jgi:hypothetical protein